MRHHIVRAVRRLRQPDDVMRAGAEVIDRLAGDLVGVDPLIEMDVAGTLGLVEVHFGVPQIHLQHRGPGWPCVTIG